MIVEAFPPRQFDVQLTDDISVPLELRAQSAEHFSLVLNGIVEVRSYGPGTESSRNAGALAHILTLARQTGVRCEDIVSRIEKRAAEELSVSA